ncbi:hypothetical protein CAP35_01580 [Chitinophagaceae bacterium IBVUCB1]|nr:hypothetical protein CAP35_01580 [Chitinophagaceae bacterium IBVUCB1]
MMSIYCVQAQITSPIKVTISTNNYVIGTHIDTSLLDEVYDNICSITVKIENISKKPVVVNQSIYGNYSYIMPPDYISFKIYYRKNHKSKYVECQYQFKMNCIFSDEEYTQVLRPRQSISERINPFTDVIFKGAGEYKIYCLYRMPLKDTNTIIKSNTINIEFKPDTFITEDNSFILRARAREAYEKGDYVLAGIMYQRLTENEQLNAEWQYRLGLCYLKVKNYERAYNSLGSASYNSSNIEYRKAYISLLKEMNDSTQLDIELKELSQIIQSADSFKKQIAPYINNR